MDCKGIGTGENNRVKSKRKTATTQGMREDGLSSVWAGTVNSLGGITVLQSSCVLRLSASRFSSVTTDYRSLFPCISGVHPACIIMVPSKEQPPSPYVSTVSASHFDSSFCPMHLQQGKLPKIPPYVHHPRFRNTQWLSCW